MSTIVSPELILTAPDHTQLPCSDGKIVENFQELPQGILLTTSIRPILRQIHPDGQFAIGANSGVYFRVTNPPLRGCVAPDWFYVPNVPPDLEGVARRSYVMWQEGQSPLIVIEFVSGNGAEERDKTPGEGKFWIYEQRVRAPYYAIYFVDPGRVEVYALNPVRYHEMQPNNRGHFPINEIGVELGIWEGEYHGLTLPWLRWYDNQGNLVPIPEERAEEAENRIEEADLRAKQASRRAEEADKLAALEREKALKLAEHCAPSASIPRTEALVS